MTLPPMPPVPTQAICLEFPLRPNFVAQFVVPRDMTLAEARRLKAFLKTLAIGEVPKETI